MLQQQQQQQNLEVAELNQPHHHRRHPLTNRQLRKPYSQHIHRCPNKGLETLTQHSNYLHDLSHEKEATVPSSPAPLIASAGPAPISYLLGTSNKGDDGAVALPHAAAAAALWSALGHRALDDARLSAAFSGDHGRAAALDNASFPSLVNHLTYREFARTSVLIQYVDGIIATDAATATVNSTSDDSEGWGGTGGVVALTSVLVAPGCWDAGRPGGSSIERATDATGMNGVVMPVGRTAAAVSTAADNDHGYENNDGHENNDDTTNESNCFLGIADAGADIAGDSGSAEPRARGGGNAAGDAGGGGSSGSRVGGVGDTGALVAFIVGALLLVG
ncbi:hypothetical protein SLS62_001760 [Diatrype stigma]|uniref:Uncharacterized protein n=1 Tax=Diatrype stigma TaxID=117547 RepID=A0AAN9YRE5_9PEZI